MSPLRGLLLGLLACQAGDRVEILAAKDGCNGVPSGPCQEPVCCPSGWLSGPSDSCNPCSRCAGAADQPCGGEKLELCAPGLFCKVRCGDTGLVEKRDAENAGLIEKRDAEEDIYDDGGNETLSERVVEELMEEEESIIRELKRMDDRASNPATANCQSRPGRCVVAPSGLDPADPDAVAEGGVLLPGVAERDELRIAKCQDKIHCKCSHSGCLTLSNSLGVRRAAAATTTAAADSNILPEPAMPVVPSRTMLDDEEERGWQEEVFGAEAVVRKRRNVATPTIPSSQTESSFCFLTNIRDPLNPTANCYPDAAWDQSRGQFYSFLACSEDGARLKHQGVVGVQGRSQDDTAKDQVAERKDQGRRQDAAPVWDKGKGVQGAWNKGKRVQGTYNKGKGDASWRGGGDKWDEAGWKTVESPAKIDDDVALDVPNKKSDAKDESKKTGGGKGKKQTSGKKPAKATVSKKKKVTKPKTIQKKKQPSGTKAKKDLGNQDYAERGEATNRGWHWSSGSRERKWWRSDDSSSTTEELRSLLSNESKRWRRKKRRRLKELFDLSWERAVQEEMVEFGDAVQADRVLQAEWKTVADFAAAKGDKLSDDDAAEGRRRSNRFAQDAANGTPVQKYRRMYQYLQDMIEK